MGRRIRTLDLFSGIGGFSLALRHVAKTVAYCDIDPQCRAVLERKQGVNKLDRAPIFDDVTKLPFDEIRAMKPEIITGGFPCQDISCIAPITAKGLDGPRSKLFFEIPRIAKAVPSIQHIFMENSPCIVSRGLDRVIAALRKAGFAHIAYGYFAAEDVGALHKRKRWFCLASKSPDSLPIMSAPQLRKSLAAPGGSKWTDEPAPRLIDRPTALADYNAIRKRLSMLGNSVVPQTVGWLTRR